MNFSLYKTGLKGSWKIFAIFAAVLTMYFTIIVMMFDPELGAALDEFSKAMPELMAMVGMNAAGTSLVGFMGSYLYGFIMLVFPMVYSILTANRLVAKQVERGSMAYLLAAPVSRFKIAFTQMMVLLTGIVALVAYAAVVGVVSAQAMFPGELDIPRFMMLNLGALALQLFIGGICFITSCIFNDTKYSIGLGAGIPALSFVIQMAANAGEKFENLKYATFFTLFSPNGIIEGEIFAFVGVAVLAAGALILYVISIAIFTKKDMPV